MKAIYTAAFLVLASLSLSSCLDNVVVGRGATSTETRNITQAFNSVEIDAPVDANISIQPGSSATFSLSGYGNLLKHVRTEVKDSVLRIFLPEITEIHTDKNLVAQITLPSLIDLSISGSSDVHVNGNIVTPDFSADLSGSGSITLQSIQADNLHVEMSGEGTFAALAGKVGVAEYDASGSVSLKTYGVETRRVRVDMSGAGKAEVFATEKLKADISGNADVLYKGNPQLISDVSGVGSVSRAGGSPNASDSSSPASNRDTTDESW